MPIYSLSREQSLSDNMPGEAGKGFKEMIDSGSTSDMIFEAYLTGDISTFGTASKGGPFVGLTVGALTKHPDSTDDVVTLGNFELKTSLVNMPALFGSKFFLMLETLIKSFLPLTDLVVAFEPNLTNARENAKGAECWDARLVTANFWKALLLHGIPLDVTATLAMFDGKPVLMEDQHDAAKFTTSPKSMVIRAAMRY